MEKTGIEVLDFFEGAHMASGIRDLLLSLGEDYRRDDSLLLPKELKLSGPKKMCYKNAGEIALENPDFSYVEGYAIGSLSLPLPHAWLINSKGQVIDPTWDDGRGYFGIKLDRSELVEALSISGEWGFLQSLWYKEELVSYFQNIEDKRRSLAKIS